MCSLRPKNRTPSPQQTESHDVLQVLSARELEAMSWRAHMA